MTLCSRGSRRRGAARSFRPHSGIWRIATSPDEPDCAEEADVTGERHGDAEPHERRVASVHNEQSAEIRSDSQRGVARSAPEREKPTRGIDVIEDDDEVGDDVAPENLEYRIDDIECDDRILIARQPSEQVQAADLGNRRDQERHRPSEAHAHPGGSERAYEADDEPDAQRLSDL